jgi:hypothetical protein
VIERKKRTSFKDIMVWLFARKTKAGSQYLYGSANELEGLIAVAVRRAYQNNRTWRAQGRREVQYEDGDFTVKVRSGYSRDSDADVTDIMIIPRHDNPRGSHQHVIIDEDGNEIMNEWREK